MKRNALLLLLIVTGPGPMIAQETVRSLPDTTLQRCLLESGPDVWAALVLSADQLQRMKLVQDACKEECAAATAERPLNAISTADGLTVLDELRNILTPEQFSHWSSRCGEHP